ncbi:hypothetical protein PV326_009332, partial [Microctonus aethiopoides]
INDKNLSEPVYAIVLFTDEWSEVKSIDTIPYKWLTERDGKWICQYPSTTDYNKRDEYLKKLKDPQPQWKEELGKAVGKLGSAGVNNESNQTNKQSNAESIEKKTDEKKYCIKEGRRIVQLKVLAENLYCKDCKNVLSLEDIQNEKQHGLASVFYVKYSDCQTVTGVHTDLQHFCKDTGKYHYYSNTNAAAGMPPSYVRTFNRATYRVVK